MTLYAVIVLGSFGHRSWSAARRAAAETPGRVPPRGPLIARSVGKVERIDPGEIDWIEGGGNYARLHVGDRRVLIRRTLASLCEELAAAGFVRVHRSAIVNVGRVVSCAPGLTATPRSS